MRTLTIKTSGLYDAIYSAKDFGLSGWRLPVFCQEFNSEQELFDALIKGDVTISLVAGRNWLSNSYQPGALELVGVKPWTCDDDFIAVFITLTKEIKDNASAMLKKISFEIVFDYEKIYSTLENR